MEENKLFMQELEAFLKSKKGVPAEEAKADPEGQKLKGKWLKIVEDMKAADESGSIAATMEGLNANADEIRAKIGKLVYEGTATEENIKAVVEKNIPETQQNGCAVCSTCSTCVSCGLCGLCFISGIAVASVTSTISTISAISAINN